MSDEKQTQQTPQASEPAPISIIERAEAANAKAEALIKKQEELLQRQEEIAAKSLLSGKSFSGQTPEVKIETSKEYADRVMRNKV